jgi:hypothetical protein
VTRSFYNLQKSAYALVLLADADMEDDDIGDSEVEYYKQVEKQRAAKLATKAEIYSRYVSTL